MPPYLIETAASVRVYGSIEIVADSVEDALAKAQAEKIQYKVNIRDTDYSNQTEAVILTVLDEDNELLWDGYLALETP